jgi:pSer/pThr/pTyr-binding forkhead associated (FHA) protein
MDEPPKSPEGPETGKLNPEYRRTIVVPGSGSFGLDTSLADISYIAVPEIPAARRKQTSWRIILRFGTPSPRVAVGLDVGADIVFGRGSEGPNSPDIDLSELDALKFGVSRRHALLRPTPNKLFLIDLDSTNGTMLNAVPVGRGMAQALRSGDAISLGGLNFTVEIVREPWQVEKEVKPPQAATPDMLPVAIPRKELEDIDGPPTIHMKRIELLGEEDEDKSKKKGKDKDKDKSKDKGKGKDKGKDKPSSPPDK